MAETKQVDMRTASAQQVIGVLIGPLAWAADLLISYSLVYHACSTGHEYILHVVSAICFVVALAGAVMSWIQFQQFRDASDDGGSPFDRSHFLALFGLLSSIGFAIVIIAISVPRWIFSPCE